MRLFLSQKRIVTLLVIILAFIGVQSAAAQEKSFYWDRFDVDITLMPNGDLRIVEKQSIVFDDGMFSYGYAELPVGIFGGNDGITDISVQEGDINYTDGYQGVGNYFTTYENSQNTEINWYFPPTEGTHSYKLSYTALTAIHKATDDSDGDQIFWKAIGSDGRSASVESSLVRVNLPVGLSPQTDPVTNNLMVAAYINGNEARNVAIDVSADGRTITFDNQNRLGPDDQFEVRVQFPADVYNMPASEWQAARDRSGTWAQVLLWLSINLMIIGPLAVLLLWYFWGRDPDPGVVPEYLTGPPDRISAGLLGTVVDEFAEFRDILGSIFDLAQRGYLSIREIKETKVTIDDNSPADMHLLAKELQEAGHAWFESDSELHIGKDDHQLLLENSDWRDLHGFEQQILTDLFEGENSRLLSELKYEFSSKLEEIQRGMYDELMARNLFQRAPDRVRTFYYIVAAVFAVLGVLWAAFAIPILINVIIINLFTLILPAVALVVIAVALAVAARHMPAKTLRGSEIAVRGEAFKKYMTDIEQYANLSEEGELFGRYLPYAIAFGLQDEWVERFKADAPQAPIPSWYRPYRPTLYLNDNSESNQIDVAQVVGIGAVAAGITGVLKSTNKTLKSIPPSSSTSSSSYSGSSFSGGGFSSGGGARGFG